MIVDLSDYMNTILMSLGRYVAILIISYILTAFSFPYLYRLMMDSNMVRPNYRNERIPATGGLLFVLLIPLTTVLGMIFRVPSFSTLNAVLFLWVILGMGLVGFIDDAIGNHEQKGFHGHLKALFSEKKLTTGGFKAVFGSIVALVFSMATAKLTGSSLNIFSIILNFFLVVLSANTINLFDLRPGRAGKVFLLGFILILAFSKNFEKYIGLFVPILAVVLYYLPYDLKARVMMGDVGSNLIGASLGVMMAWMFTDMGKIIAIAILVVLHLFAEKISFTKVIDENRVLRSIDNVGRRKN